MEDMIKKAATNMVCHMQNRAFAKVAEYYHFPAAVYFGENIIVLKNKDEMIHALGVYRDVLDKQKLSRIVTHVVDAPREKKNRFTVSLANTYLDTEGEAFDTSLIQFFVQREVDCLRIRLVEYVDWPCERDIAMNKDIRRLCRAPYSPIRLETEQDHLLH